MGVQASAAAVGDDRATFALEETGRPNEGHEPRNTVVAAVDANYERLTPRNAVVLLIDHQIGPLWELEFASTRRAVVTLATTVRREAIPVVITTIEPATWGAVIPELSDVLEGAPHIMRTAVNAWQERAVRGAVERSSRRKLIVAGAAAQVAVTLCALSAVRAGYTVYAPIDASAQFSHPAITRLSQAGVIVTTTELVAAELALSPARRTPRSPVRPRRDPSSVAPRRRGL